MPATLLEMAQGVFIVTPDANDPRDIHFAILPNTSDIPEDQQKFADNVHRTLTVLRGLFPDGDAKYKSYYNSLIGLCIFAVVGPSAQPTHGLRALTTFQEDVVANEGGRIKNNYMKKLGLNALYMSVPAFLIAWALVECEMIDMTTASFFILWGGCMAGVWLSFGSRKTILKFESLHILEEDRLEPVIRLVFAGLLTVTLGLLFITGAVKVTVGDLSTTNIIKDIKIALLVGLFCGISEQALSTTVTEQATKFLKFS